MKEGLVKSAARALDILEVFAIRREPLTATDIGVALGYPKSSLSMLLRSLVIQGYLSETGKDQAYLPTLKVARLGDWVTGALIGSERLIDILEELRGLTGETVTLTGAVDLQMRCLHALIGTHPIALQVTEGVRFPMMGTAIGTAWLAAQKPEEVERLMTRWSKQEQPGADEVENISLAIMTARESGRATAYDAVVPDTGAVAMAVTSRADDVLVVAIAGLNSRIRAKEDEISEIMSRALVQFRVQAG